ncbi:MAG: serine/threonine protein kinase, partial [Pirellulaceae bacterium]
MSTSDPVQSIADQFRSDWSADDRPWIAQYLARVGPDEHEQLLEVLVPIDIEFRQKSGERPQANDYMQLGAVAVGIAWRDLHESFEHQAIDTSRDGGITVLEPTSSDCAHGGTRRTEDDEGFGISPLEMASEFIGPYKLLQQIGTGGMGSVWMAEQQEPVKRRVALKVIRADLGSRKSIARFEAERQAIAMMNHQNIARILDAGTTDAGHPWLVMELVKGIPLNRYCDRKKLSVRERLELMLPVCRAIQHAHQKGIIHRDLKHSNVLVAHSDGKPMPKVIDFGLAKSSQTQLTDKTMFTEYGKVVGTLQYMSPEQAATDAIDVDTRTDIYALGVMIYKLLTGTTPLPNDTVSSQSLIQVLELIRHQEPPRPSVRLAEAKDPKKLGEQRQTTRDKVAQEVGGDLDWIVMKALDKDRERRYETANALALDIERYLNDEEVRARPPSTSYRIQKFVKRNRGLVASALISSLLLLAGIIGTSSGFFWALNERDRANRHSVEAEEEATNARIAENEARESEARSRKLQMTAEARLRAIRLKSAWSDWQLGNVETAWQMIKSLDDMGKWESRFLRTEFNASEDVLYGHALNVLAVDASPDGRWIATAAVDQTVRLWDAVSRELVYSREIDGSPTALCFS